MTTTTLYGTWCTRVNSTSSSPDEDVETFIGGGDPEWRELLEETGALDEIKRDYRNAIEAVLPADISLCGDEFIGPAYPEEGEFDGYETDDDGDLDFAAMIEEIDLAAIVEDNEPITLDEIGRDELGAKGKNPAKAASDAMSRLKLKPFTYRRSPETGRPQAIYLKGEVRRVLASRPGRGKRTDRVA